MEFEIWPFTFWWFRISTEESDGKGLPSIEQPVGSCESCILGKHHREKFISGVSYREKTPLEVVHIDLCGSMQTPSLTGNVYFVYH